MSSSAPQTVSTLSILFMVVSLLVCFGVPIGLAIWAKVKYRKAFSFLPLLLGAAGFFVFQIIIRVSIMLPLIQATPWFKSAITMPVMTWLYAAFLCITAGLFEEPVRFLAYTILKKKRQFPDGLSYGIGHGGIEAIMLVGLTFINNIVYSLMINSGSWDKMLSVLPATYQAQLATVHQALIMTSPSLFLMGGAERLFTMAIQIALSLVVLKGFMVNKKWLYLVVAIFLHTLIDFPAALAGLHIVNINPWVLEGSVFIEAVIATLYIIKQAKDWHRNLNKPTEVLDGEQGQTDTL
jgi:uncharacterized membrane protein YhfC